MPTTIILKCYFIIERGKNNTEMHYTLHMLHFWTI